MQNKLNLARQSNPLLADKTDDEVLATTYSRFYKDKIDYNSFQEQMTKPMNLQEQNAFAFRNYYERQNLTSQAVQDYLNKQEAEELTTQGERGFIESFKEQDFTNLVPFYADYDDYKNKKRLNEINQKAKDGITLSTEEQVLFNEEKRKLKEDLYRPYTIGGHIGANVYNTARFGIEFMATGAALKGVGLVAKGFGLIKGGSTVAKGANTISKVGKTIANATGRTIINPLKVANEYQAKQLNGDLLITDKGEIFFGELQKSPLKTLTKSFGSVFVDNLTEMSGAMITPLTNKLYPLFNKTAQKVFGEGLTNTVQKIGWDGFIEETFEEYLSKPLNQILGITDEAYTLDNFLNSLEMSMDEFLVITGSTAIQGGTSYTTAKLINKLQTSKVSSENINNYVNTTTELEREDALKKFQLVETQQEQEALNTYLDNLQQQALNSGRTKQEAEAQRTLLNIQFTKYAEEKGVSRIKLAEMYNLEVRRGKEVKTKQNIKQNANNNKIIENYKVDLNNIKDFEEYKNFETSNSSGQIKQNNNNEINNEINNNNKNINNNLTNKTNNSQTIYTPNNREIKVQYEVVDLKDLITSNDLEGKINEGYLKELQPRDRSRNDSKMQIINIASQLNPNFLGYSADTITGAPIVGQDNMVESGNGRVLSLNYLYNNSQLQDRKDNYIKFIQDQGFNTDNIEQPVLIRKNVSNLSLQERVDYTRESNVSNIKSLSIGEQAVLDGKKIIENLEIFNLFNSDKSLQANKDFIKAYINKIIPKNEQAQLIANDGTLTTTGLERIQKGLLSSIIDDKLLINKITEESANNIKNITNVLIEVAPTILEYESLVKQELVENIDLKQNINDFVRLVTNAREENTNPLTYIKQLDLLDQPNEFINILIENSYRKSGREISTKTIADFINEYIFNSKITFSTEASFDFGIKEKVDKLAILKRSINNVLNDKSEFIKQNTKQLHILNQAINTDLDLQQEVEVLDISKHFNGKITKETIKQKIQELIDKKEPIKTLSDPYMIDLLNSKKKHIINGSRYGDLTKQEFFNRNNQLLNIDSLIQNSVLIERVENTKKDKKPKVDNYYYFYTPIKDGNNIFIIKLIAENGKNNNVVNLYDVMIEKELNTSHNRTKSALEKQSINSFSNPTIKQLLENVKDINGKNALESYFEENSDVYNQTAYHGSPFSFDKFTLDHIGKGEGAQTHGYGLYFALNKKVAKTYQVNIENSGLYKVAIPEDNSMLFENKSFKEQPKEVQTNINRLLKDKSLDPEIIDNIKHNLLEKEYKGKDLYNDLRDELYSERSASELLNKYGIEGIRYNGNLDGECAVVFNNKSINILEKLNQTQAQTIKGQIQLGNEGALISLFETADKSTLLHETAHYFLKFTELMAKSGSKIAEQELKAVEKYFTDESKIKGTLYSTQEKFARSFEAYLRRGIAPNNKLKQLFEDFREWLLDVYKSVVDLNINITPEIIDFFDNYIYNPNKNDINNNNINNNDINNNISELEYQQEQLQTEIENERELLFQQGMSEDEVEKVIEEKYSTRIKTIEEAINKSMTNSNDVYKEFQAKKETFNKNKFIKSLANTKQNINDFFDYLLVNENQRIREISENIYKKLINLAFSKSYLKNELKTKTQNFVNKTLKIRSINKNDYDKMSIAWYLGDLQTIADISTNYNIYDDFLKVREVLEDLYYKQLEVGVDLPYRENYLPTKIKTGEYDNLMLLIEKTIDTEVFNDINKKIMEQGLSGDTALQFVNNYLRGFVPNSILLSPSNFTKKRTLDVSPDYYPFYQDFLQTFNDYIDTTVNNIEERRFFGKSTKETQTSLTLLKRKQKQWKELQTTAAGKIKKNELYKLNFEKLSSELRLKEYQNLLLKNINEIIKKDGTKLDLKTEIELLKTKIKDLKNEIVDTEKTNEFVVKARRQKLRLSEIDNLKTILKNDATLEESIGSFIIKENDLSFKNQKDLTNLLKSLFNKPIATDKFNKTVQALDTSSSIYVLANLKSMLKQFAELGNSLYKNGYVNTFTALFNSTSKDFEKIGFTKIFNLKDPNKLNEILTKSLHYIGFEKVDFFGKKTFLKASLIKTQKLLQQNDKAINLKLELQFGNQAEQVKEDLLNNKLSFNALSYLFSQLSEVQPITAGAKTQLYNDHPSLRFMYTLKSYVIQQISTVKNDIILEAKRGNYSTAMTNLVKMQIALWVSGIPIAMLTHLIFDDDDKEYGITDAMIDNIILNNIINRFNLGYLATGRIVEFITGTLSPVFIRPAQYLISDLFKIITGDFEESKFIKNMSLFRNLPKVMGE